MSCWHWCWGCMGTWQCKTCVSRESSWTTGMNESFHINTHPCAVEDTCKLSEEKKKVFHSHRPWCCGITLCTSHAWTVWHARGPYYTTVWRLVADQFPDHLGLTQPEDESSLFFPRSLQIKSVTLYALAGKCMDLALFKVLSTTWFHSMLGCINTECLAWIINLWHMHWISIFSCFFLTKRNKQTQLCDYFLPLCLIRSKTHTHKIKYFL